MNGYVIANIDVKNIEAYKEYIEKVSPIVKKFGGEYLTRGGEMDVVLQDSLGKPTRLVFSQVSEYEGSERMVRQSRI